MAFGSADGRVVIDTELDNKGFLKGVKSLSGQLGGLQSVVGKLGSAIASAFAVRALVNFGKECVELGSNVAEVQNVVDVSFGDMSYKVEEFANNAIKNFGISSLAAKKTASTYMAMAKGMGISDDVASDMSIALAGLTGDVASFYNISQELADVKLKSVFTGETESLKDLGIVMSQANLEAYALEHGITKSLDAMTQGEKVALRYNYVMDSLALAQGDFSRTSEGWANQTRILSMQWQEFMSIIGQALVTVLTPCIKALNEIVSRLISVAKAINTAVSSMFGVQENASSVSNSIEESVDNQNNLTEATQKTAKAQNNLIAGLDEIRKLNGDTDSASESGGSIIPVAPVEIKTSADVSADSPVLRFFDKLREAVQPTIDAVGRLWEKLKGLGSALGSELSGNISRFYTDFLVPVGTWVLGEGLPALIDLIAEGIDKLPLFGEKVSQMKETAETAFSGVSSAIEGLSGAFQTIWEDVVSPVVDLIKTALVGIWDGITSAWEKYGESIFEKIRDAISKTAGTISTIWKNILLPVWKKFMGVVDNLWNKHLKPLWDKILDFVGSLISAALDIYNGFVLPVANWFAETVGPVISKVFGTILEVAGSLVGGLIDHIGYIIDVFSGLINFLAGVFTGDWERAWEGVKSIFFAQWNAIKNFFETIVDAITKLAEGIADIFKLEDIKKYNPNFTGYGPDYSWMFNSSARIGNVPGLATGSVIPPNRQFLAVLGDNKTETEVVSPLSTMKQAMLEAMRESGGMGGTIVVKTYLDGRQIAENQVRHINEMSRENGSPVIVT